MAIGKHHTRYDNATDTWLTPPEMIEELGPFDTDPCCPANMTLRTATKMITPAECGLLTPWTGRVWMNPPYLWNEVFTDKFIQHKNGIMLSFARTETVWFQKLKDAHAFLFLKGRLTFHKLDGTAGKGNAGAPSVLIAFGAVNVLALRNYQIKHGGLFLK